MIFDSVSPAAAIIVVAISAIVAPILARLGRGNDRIVFSSVTLLVFAYFLAGAFSLEAMAAPAPVSAYLHAATKASGAAFALIALCLRMPAWETFGKALLAIGFAFLTLPVAAHLLARGTLSSPGATANESEEV